MYPTTLAESDITMALSMTLSCVRIKATFEVLLLLTLLLIGARSLCREPTISLTGQTVRLSSFDNNASICKDTLWTFNTSEGRRVTITFLEFNLNMGYDLLYIGDGVDTGTCLYQTCTYPKLASFSGSVLPSNVTSVSNAAWIYHCDKNISGANKSHFDIEIDSTLASNSREEDQLIMDQTLVITSPLFPGNYPNNFYHLWDIRAPDGFVIAVNVITFDVEAGSDHVFIGDGSQFTKETMWRDWTGTYTGEYLRDMSFTSITSYITMVFTTDQDRGKRGFNITFQATATVTSTATGDTTTVSPDVTTNTTYSLSTSTSPQGIDVPLVFSPVIIIIVCIVGVAAFFAYKWCHIRRKHQSLMRSLSNQVAHQTPSYFLLERSDDHSTTVTSPSDQCAADVDPECGPGNSYHTETEDHVYNVIGNDGESDGECGKLSPGDLRCAVAMTTFTCREATASASGPMELGIRQLTTSVGEQHGGGKHGAMDDRGKEMHVGKYAIDATPLTKDNEGMKGEGAKWAEREPKEDFDTQSGCECHNMVENILYTPTTYQIDFDDPINMNGMVRLHQLETTISIPENETKEATKCNDLERDAAAPTEENGRDGAKSDVGEPKQNLVTESGSEFTNMVDNILYIPTTPPQMYESIP